MTDRRPFLRSIFDAAVAAAHPDVVLSAHLRPAPKGRVICLAAGKGAAAMAAAAERHYLDTLGLEAEASTHEVKTRFKQLVKRHHPDANGGDRSSEDRLREIIQAYNYLKSIGFR